VVFIAIVEVPKGMVRWLFSSRYHIFNVLFYFEPPQIFSQTRNLDFKVIIRIRIKLTCYNIIIGWNIIVLLFP